MRSTPQTHSVTSWKNKCVSLFWAPTHLDSLLLLAAILSAPGPNRGVKVDSQTRGYSFPWFSDDRILLTSSPMGIDSRITFSRPPRPISTSPQPLLDPFHLGGQLPGPSRADIGLEYERHPRAHLRHRLAGGLDHRHALVPLALQGGEHGGRLVGQAGVAHHSHGAGHGFGDGSVGVVGGGGGHGEGEEHATRLARRPRRPPPPRHAALTPPQ